jgi:soluble lytic murein transglycosylase-like protein
MQPMVLARTSKVVLFAAFLLMGMLSISVPANGEQNEVPLCAALPNICDMILQEARRASLDPALVDAVMKVESDYRADAIGAAGEIGLMQLRPSTARLLGFMGSDRELAEPTTNIRLGVTYLAKAWRLAQGDLCRALMKYRAGHGEDQMTPLSVEYCRRVREHLSRQNRQVAEDPATLGNMLPGIETSTRAKSRTTARALTGRAFWIAHEARIKGITALVHERWSLIAKKARRT